MNRGYLPTSLVIVAVLFIIGGASAAIEILVSLMVGHFSLNFGVLGLFIGPGLLRLSRGWRICALVFIWITLIATPLVVLLLLVIDVPLDLTVSGRRYGDAPKTVVLFIGTIIFSVIVWQLHVLTRPDIRRRFRVGFPR